MCTLILSDCKVPIHVNYSIIICLGSGVAPANYTQRIPVLGVFEFHAFSYMRIPITRKCDI